MHGDSEQYDLFISYSRRDDETGWVKALKAHIEEDQRRFSTRAIRVFFDKTDINDFDRWKDRLQGILRHSKLLLVCISENYLRSKMCRWEWDYYRECLVKRRAGDDTTGVIYFAAVSGTGESNTAEWLEQIRKTQVNVDLQEWFPRGTDALRDEDVRARLASLGLNIYRRVRHARLADESPGNVDRVTDHFVGREAELRILKEKIQLHRIGAITAVQGLGGLGKTELALAYAHAFASDYPGGRWLVRAEGAPELCPLLAAQLLAPLNLDFIPNEPPQSTVARILTSLKERAFTLRRSDPDREGRPNPDAPASVLLLLDNVSDANLLGADQVSALPEESWLHVLATTRLDPRRLGHEGHTLELGTIPDADARRIFLSHLPGEIWPPLDGYEQGVLNLIRELGGFTLAIEQSAIQLALAENARLDGIGNGLHPSDFLNSLRAAGFPALDFVGVSPEVASRIHHRGKQLGVILAQSVAALPPAARTALSYATVFAPETIPLPWVRELTAKKHPELDAPATGALALAGADSIWTEITRSLDGLGLLARASEPELWKMHRLVAAHFSPLATRKSKSRLA